MTVKTAAIAASLFALASAAFAAGPAYHASDWTDYSQTRPVPETIYAGNDCKDAKCRKDAWLKMLSDRGETDLDSPPGGRSYRALVDGYQVGLGLYIVRLDIAADGRATVTSSYPKQEPRIRAMPIPQIEAFDAAIAQSQLAKATASPKTRDCKDGDETVFEALVEDRYRFIVQPCADEAGLNRAIDILRRI
ncbi:hypothetical protein BH11PSE2_BH11PSE2_10100 [soil metagenome]